jgi:hypothetical protein
VQQAQQLAAEAERVVMEASQSQAGERRRCPPPTCTKCHVEGHTRTSCRARYIIISRSFISFYKVIVAQLRRTLRRVRWGGQLTGGARYLQLSTNV